MAVCHQLQQHEAIGAGMFTGDRHLLPFGSEYACSFEPQPFFIKINSNKTKSRLNTDG